MSMKRKRKADPGLTQSDIVTTNRQIAANVSEKGEKKKQASELRRIVILVAKIYVEMRKPMFM